ncbi:MAG: hypothetical protein KAY37_13895 [Phycisphaerae bacterium]|nr:hypothetical protein [Phycisphaerae bacterium]
MRANGRERFEKHGAAGITGAALAGTLILSAFVTAVALAVPNHPWVAWISLLPLFTAVRVLRPPLAMLYGALWGVCLFLFAARIGPAVAPTPYALVLLALVPAAYAGFGAWLTRRIGFSPLMLGLGWILVEVALKPLGLRQGLLAGTQTENTYLHWIARGLGYVFVAALVAGGNAALLELLTWARLPMPAPRILPRVPVAEMILSPRPVPYVQRWILHQAYPRAPPGRIAP